MTSKGEPLCINEKVLIIREIEKGWEIGDVARCFGYSPSTVSTIWNNKEKILQTNNEGKGKSSKKLRKSKHKNLNQAVLKWCHQQHQNNVPISGPALIAKAEELAKDLGLTSFKVSEGWLGRFKDRHNIEFGKICQMENQNIKLSQIVGLNVGGRLFQTTIGILSTYDSMLRTMVTGDLKSVTDEHGMIFIDRCGKHFETILNYLQDGKIDLPKDLTQVEEILAEAKYYLIDDLIAKCETALALVNQIRCNVVVITSQEEEWEVIASTSKPVVKLILNSSNCTDMIKKASQPLMLEHVKLFFKLAQRFGDRGVFMLDSIHTLTACGWEFYANEQRCGEIQCTTVETTFDHKVMTVIDFPEGKITEEALATFLKCM